MVRSRVVRPVTGRLAAAIVAAVMVGAAPAARGDNPAQQVEQLRDRDATLASEARSAELELYALDSKLDAARARVASVEARRAEVIDRRADVRKQLAVARGTLLAAETFLANRVRLLYEQGATDPLEILFGASSLEDAISDLDGLQFAAQQDKEVIERTLAARKRLVRLGKRLDAQSAELGRLRDAAAAEAAALASAREARAGFLARLVAERRVNLTRITELETQVDEARARTARIVVDSAEAGISSISAPAPSMPTPAAAAAGGGRTITVVATGYALPGRTATGIPVGWGVVAVDPGVIPLGTRMTIPGYGEGVAADVGPAVRGAKIDLWFPTVRQALDWGVRTVTITLH